MAIVIALDFEEIEFEIRKASGSGTVKLTVPPLDCLRPKDMKNIDKQIEEDGIQSPDELVRLMLKYYNKGKAAHDAIDNLTVRETVALDKAWDDASRGEEDLGESSDSGE